MQPSCLQSALRKTKALTYEMSKNKTIVIKNSVKTKYNDD